MAGVGEAHTDSCGYGLTQSRVVAASLETHSSGYPHWYTYKRALTQSRVEPRARAWRASIDQCRMKLPGDQRPVRP